MTNILKISEAASIALHSMMILAQNQDKIITVKDIADKLDISSNHLSKVLQRLVKEDLVKSVKGAKGGFKIGKSPETITFLEIYEAIDGRFLPQSCLLGKFECKGECIMGDLVHSINKQVKDYFEKTRLSGVIG